MSYGYQGGILIGDSDAQYSMGGAHGRTHGKCKKFKTTAAGKKRCAKFAKVRKAKSANPWLKFLARKRREHPGVSSAALAKRYAPEYHRLMGH